MNLRLVSLMARNADPMYQALAACLGARLGSDIRIIDDVPWQERERLLDHGDAHAGFICGLPYVRQADSRDPQFELLAAPVMQAPRYRGRPIYYSDVVVRRDSPYLSFADLRGARWAYNEPGSQSGYNLVRAHLARNGERQGYFSRVVEAGAHQESLRLIQDGHVDASAIDATVLELELKLRPELARQLRVIETLGPSGIPPAVVRKDVPPRIRARLRETLCTLHQDEAGRAALELGLVSRYVPVPDSAYDGIRRMAREAEGVRLELASTRPSVRSSSTICGIAP